MEPLAIPWLDRAEYPFRSNFITLNGQRLHYIDEGAGETLLFVHGTPSWSFDFRNVIKPLSSQFRCVALDHIGFGLSAKPRQYDYSTQRHAQTLREFIESLHLQDITLIMHDFGGPIGFSYALQQPAQIRRIVVLNSWLWSSELEPGFQKMRKVLRNPLLPFLYRYLNISPRFIVPASFGDKSKLTPAIHRHYTRPFARPADRNGLLAFARSLLHDQPWFESLWEQRHRLTNKPMVLVWGLKDPLVTPEYLRRFQAGFPQSQTLTLPQSGHFPQEEESEAVVGAIFRLMQETP
ncbi:alpha/beta fold hydrolase [Larkinella sp. VNQ87]|uniref:alpha/beta fold hydrolase n=1 Tax=Larkinella sp. VNQ87 TaxID=3400921 RepID=UPI003C118022